MATSLLEQLQQKITLAASEIVSLRKESKRLSTEVELMQEENRRSRRVIRDYDELVKEREALKAKLEKILEKIDKLRI